MNHLGLFEGIGGFSLAARWMEWKTVGWCEWEPFCQEVLRKNFPEVIEENQHGDITKTDFTKYRGTVDILTGGFPCQPYSSAGKRKGTEDPRHLWPEMLRSIREVQPRYVVGENVRGLTNWNGGLVFDQVQADLETEGYEVLPFLLPACGVEAPHERSRIWFIAYSDGFRCNGYKKFQKDINRGIQKKLVEGFIIDPLLDVKPHTNTNGHRLQRDITKTPTQRDVDRLLEVIRWENYPSESPICRTDDGIPNRVDRIKSLGNAIVPQVAFEIFKAIEQTDFLN